ncbi:hypothetical protein [Promineifilum sp.]|uniref:hypothetical protein n=1 Tax=Promineifilum sp. TaxID=2664178 RepID=UPI0035B293A2
MNVPVPRGVKPVVPAMRVLLYAASVLVAPIALLFVLPDRTDTLAAWPIKPPLTAATLGAAYLGAFFLAFLAARQTIWARARIAFPAIFIISVLLLIATLLHLDRFHFNHPAAFTRFLAWLWLVAYALFPVVMPLALLIQLRQPGTDPPRVAPLPGWYRALLVVQGIICVLVGAILFLTPALGMDIWPWELTPLTARALGGWAVAMGALALHAAWENDWPRLPAMMAGYTVLGVLQLVNLARFAATPAWNSAAAWLYLAVIVVVTFTGGYGWLKTRQETHREGAHAL